MRTRSSSAISISLFAWWLPGVSVIFFGCLGTDDPSGVARTCFGYGDNPARGSKEYSLCRVFRGRLQLPPAKELILPSKPFQVLGLAFEPRIPSEPVGETDSGIEGTSGAPTSEVDARFFYGALFSALEGAGQRPAIPFSITVPCGLSVNLLLQLARSGNTAAPGIQVAQMKFAVAGSSTELSTLIPWQADDYCGERTNQLDLGLVVLKVAQRGELASGSIELGQGNSKSPLDLIPAPEGQPTEQDRNGDGIVDSAQTFSALPDLHTPGTRPGEDPSAAQPDGIPDLFQ